MTQITIDAQVNAIKKATEKAIKTKETALKFLVDAGIVDSNKAKSSTGEQIKKK